MYFAPLSEQCLARFDVQPEHRSSPSRASWLRRRSCLFLGEFTIGSALFHGSSSILHQPQSNFDGGPQGSSACSKAKRTLGNATLGHGDFGFQ